MRQKTVERLTLTAVLISAALSASAQYLSPSQRALAFATCAGRFLAVESRWGEPMPEDSASALFDSLVDATLPDAIDYGMPERAAIDARVQAWRSHAYLRQDMRHAVDSRRIDRAAAQLKRDLESCKALVL